MSWAEETHVWLPRAMIFWFLSIEKRTNQISQSWERMLNDLYIRLKRRFQTLKPILWMTVTLFSAIFWSGSADKGFFSTRPTWRSCQCQVSPILFVSLSRWWIQFLVYIFKSNLYLAWLPTDYGVLTRLGEDEVAKPATTVHIVSEYIMEITF